jgi:hypothetical protein
MLWLTIIEEQLCKTVSLGIYLVQKPLSIIMVFCLHVQQCALTCCYVELNRKWEIKKLKNLATFFFVVKNAKTAVICIKSAQPV